MTEHDMVAYLTAHGYKVSKARPAAAKPHRVSGKRHEQCIDHHKLEGYQSALCITDGQDADELLTFARDLLAIASGAGDVLHLARMRDYGRPHALAA
jgi:hypothetical protein